MRPIPAFTFIGFFLAASAAAGPVTPTATPAPGTARPGDGQAPIAADSVGSRPVKAAGTPALLQDVANSYNQMEQSIEAQYAKLLREARDQKSSVEEKIKDIDRQVAALKEQAKKIEQVAEKMAQINAQIDALNENGRALRAQIAALDAEIAKLERDRQKALADLRAQRARAVRTSPTATPTPKRP